MISHAMVAFGAPVLGFFVMAGLAWFVSRANRRHKPRHRNFSFYSYSSTYTLK